MPRATQIIPQYTFPHEETYVNDYSVRNLDDGPQDDLSLKYLAVFGANKGKDNKLIRINSQAAREAYYGKTDYAKYGQPCLMPDAYLSNPNTAVWCMRVLPDDATYANAILDLWYKPDVANQRFMIKFTTRSISQDDVDALGEEYSDALTNRTTLIEVARMLSGADVDGVYKDEEEYIQVPLGVWTPAGRGEYGKNLRWRIALNEDYEKEYGAKLFNFEVLDVEQGVTCPQANQGMMVSDPLLKDRTSLINDVIHDLDDVNKFMEIEIFDDNFQAVYDAYVAFCNELAADDPSLKIVIPSIYQFDPIFGKKVKVEPSKDPGKIPFITFAQPLTADVDQEAEDFDAELYTETEIISVNDVSGNILLNGSDGSFASSDPIVRQAALEEMYGKAFSGNLDKLILSCRRVPAQTMYDANYSMENKLALTMLNLHRFDSLLYLDTGFRPALDSMSIRTISSDFEPIMDAIDNFDNMSENWATSVNVHDYMIKETSTAKRVRVTITYFLALTDPSYQRSFNNNPIPRTGNYCTLSGHIKDSLSPAVDESDYAIKQALKDAHLNYFEAVGENLFERATDFTFIKSNSDLGVEGNVIALFNLKRALEWEFRTKRNNITTPERRADFRTYLMSKYEYMQGKFFDTFDIQYRANEWEQKRNITHAYIAISYYPRGEVTLIEIDVNQRVYREDVIE